MYPVISDLLNNNILYKACRIILMSRTNSHMVLSRCGRQRGEPSRNPRGAVTILSVLEPCTVWAFTECMTVLNDIERVHDTTNLYLVVSESENEYLSMFAPGLASVLTTSVMTSAINARAQAVYTTNKVTVLGWVDTDTLNPRFN